MDGVELWQVKFVDRQLVASRFNHKNDLIVGSRQLVRAFRIGLHHLKAIGNRHSGNPLLTAVFPVVLVHIFINKATHHRLRRSRQGGH